MRRALLPLVVLLAAGCSRGDVASPREATAITVQVSGDPEETAVYAAAARAFEEENGDVEVRLVEIAEKDDHLAKLSTSFSGGRPPDVFLVNFREYSQFVALGGIDPIGPRLSELGIETRDYYPQPLEAFTYEGALQCMPQNISSLVVYYNTELFEKAGVSPPSKTWSWDDLRSAAVGLTSSDVRGLGIEPSIIRVAPFVWANGGELTDDPDAPTRFTLGEPRAREALEFILSLVREHEVVPTREEVAAQDLEERFVTGKLAMLLSSRRDTPVFREAQGLRWDVGPLPKAPTGERAGILHSDAYCVSRGSDNLEAAFRYVAFVTGREGQTITALGGRTVPSLKRVSRSPAFLDPARPPAHARVFLDGIDHIRRTPVIPSWPEIEDVAEEILTRAFYDEEMTLDEAIAELDAATRDLFAEGSRS